MSMPEETFFKNRPTVIVRSYKGRPARLKALSEKDGLVEVAGQDDSATIRLPSSVVFKFRESFFHKLCAAFKEGDCKELERLWSQGEPFDKGVAGS